MSQFCCNDTSHIAPVHDAAIWYFSFSWTEFWFLMTMHYFQFIWKHYYLEMIKKTVWVNEVRLHNNVVLLISSQVSWKRTYFHWCCDLASVSIIIWYFKLLNNILNRLSLLQADCCILSDVYQLHNIWRLFYSLKVLMKVLMSCLVRNLSPEIHFSTVWDLKEKKLTTL